MLTNNVPILFSNDSSKLVGRAIIDTRIEALLRKGVVFNLSGIFLENSEGKMMGVSLSFQPIEPGD